MGEEDGEFGFGRIEIRMLMRGDVQQAAECLSLEFRGVWNKDVTGKMSGRY